MKYFEGQKFGKLTIIKAQLNSSRRALVKCDCGIELEVLKNSLRTGKRIECNICRMQSNATDLTNRIFGYIAVISWNKEYSEKYALSFWNCKCICGKILIIKANYLINGHVKSCGCSSKKMNADKLRKSDLDATASFIMSSYKSNAKNRNLTFNISLKDFYQFIYNNCHYCDNPPQNCNIQINKFNERCVFYNGVDRKDNNIGYELDNCVTCCKICNFMKKDMPYYDFIFHIKKIANKMMNQFKYGVYIGRFQPFHNAHLKNVRSALNIADNVILLIGSHSSDRTIKNPWLAEERIQMIKSSFTKEESDRLIFLPIEDFSDDKSWINNILTKVTNICQNSNSIVLIGHSKDSSSYYLKYFLQWNFTEMPCIENINATDIRQEYFSKTNENWKINLPIEVQEYLLDFMNTENYKILCKSFEERK